LTLIVGTVILPAIYQTLRLSSWLADMSILLLTLTTFTVIREGLNAILLRIVHYRLTMA
jgi:hypothetical protein